MKAEKESENSQDSQESWLRREGNAFNFLHQNHLYLKVISLCFRSILFLIRNFIPFLSFLLSLTSLSTCFFSPDLKHAPHLKSAPRPAHPLVPPQKFLKKLSSHDFSNFYTLFNLPPSFIWLLSLYSIEAAFANIINDVNVKLNGCFSVS